MTDPTEPPYDDAPNREQTFVLPLPPGLNNMYPTVVVRGKPRRITSPRGKAWKKAATEIIEHQGYVTYERAVGITLTAWRDNVRSDLDGFIKPVLDVLTGLCYNDDLQVVSIVALRFTDRETPGCTVVVEDLGVWPE